MTQEPLIVLYHLTGRIYVVTKYKDLGDNKIVAIKKWDVTDQIIKLNEEIREIITKNGV